MNIRAEKGGKGEENKAIASHLICAGLTLRGEREREREREGGSVGCWSVSVEPVIERPSGHFLIWRLPNGRSQRTEGREKERGRRRGNMLEGRIPWYWEVRLDVEVINLMTRQFCSGWLLC